MGYTGKVISGDCHVDIPWLPADLFTSNAPSHLKDRMPHVEDTKDGEQWFAGGSSSGALGAPVSDCSPVYSGTLMCPESPLGSTGWRR